MLRTPWPAHARRLSALMLLGTVKGDAMSRSLRRGGTGHAAGSSCTHKATIGSDSKYGDSGALLVQIRA
jgi:hypothetical protein